MSRIVSQTLGFLAASIVATSCTSGPPILEYPPWGDVGYNGFSEYVDQKAGPNALNCGFFETFDRRRQRSYKVPGFDCVRHAVENNLSFKYGTVRLPIDSYAYQVLVRDESGVFWDITYDVMIDGDAPQQWVRRCEIVELIAQYSSYQVEDCESVHD